MENLISLLFLARDFAHREHLHTTSYSQHMALRSFYEDILDIADSIAEAYQGRFGLMSLVPIIGHTADTPIVEILKTHLKWIDDNRYAVVDKKETTLQNLIDEAVAIYYEALYKLENLS